jgi:hypothetical protein
MHRPPHRVAATLAGALAILALGAGPAFAGSDGCDTDGCKAEKSPSTVFRALSQPETIAPLRHSPHHVTVGQRTAAPRGAVSAGGGGTAPAGPGGGIVAGAVLLLTGGGLVASTRRSRS